MTLSVVLSIKKRQNRARVWSGGSPPQTARSDFEEDERERTAEHPSGPRGIMQFLQDFETVDELLLEGF